MKLLDQLAARDPKYRKAKDGNPIPEKGKGKQKLLDIIRESLKEHPNNKKKKKK